MSFVNSSWGLAWAAFIASLGALALFLILVAGARVERRIRSYKQDRLAPRSDRAGLRVGWLSLGFLCGGLLLFLVLLPLATNFPPWIDPPPAGHEGASTAELARATRAQADALTRLAETEEKLFDETRRKRTCPECIEGTTSRDGEDRVLGSPFSPLGIVGIVALLYGLFLTFGGDWIARDIIKKLRRLIGG